MVDTHINMDIKITIEYYLCFITALYQIKEVFIDRLVEKRRFLSIEPITILANEDPKSIHPFCYSAKTRCPCVVDFLAELSLTAIYSITLKNSD